MAHCNRRRFLCRATPHPSLLPQAAKESEAHAAHERTGRSRCLSPIGANGRGEAAGCPRLQEALCSVPANPLIPAFSPEGEKESEAQAAHERAGRSGSLSPIGGEG